MSALSKSKLLAFRQCERKLWLEVHHPELRDNSGSARQRQEDGNMVGEAAREIYDTERNGTFIDAAALGGIQAALEKTDELLDQDAPIFEAGFSAEGGLFFADVMRRSHDRNAPGWSIVEVKSSGSIKDYHLDDVAIQAFVAKNAGVPLTSISIATIDSEWTYPGNGDYKGLLKEEDVSERAFSQETEVGDWIRQAHEVVSRSEQPIRQRGDHCKDPVECSFASHCSSLEPHAEFAVGILPRLTNRAAKALVNEGDARDIRDLPDNLLNQMQKRVRDCTVENRAYFDLEGARADLSPFGFPAYFLDFETIAFTVPKWAGTRPFQPVPFQFSLHMLAEDGGLEHTGFLDLSGGNPARSLAEALIASCGRTGPIFAYNASFEKRVIRRLAEDYPDLQPQLTALLRRTVDLLPIARERYYHPKQNGSWSIKRLLPTIAPELSYADLSGVKDGGMAMEVYMEACSPQCTADRRKQIRLELERYCELDTVAMVAIWNFFRGVPALLPKTFGNRLEATSSSRQTHIVLS